MRFFYNLVLTAGFFLALPYLLLKYGLRGNFGEWKLRFQPLRQLDRKRLPHQPIWIHAVSVGESYALFPLYRQLKEAGYPVMISSTTTSGFQVVQRALSPTDSQIYFPFDFSNIIKKCFAQLQPKACVIMETEIWPNFFFEAKERKIPLFLFNGRISDRSWTWYKKARVFFKHPLAGVSAFGMQSENDAERMIQLGAPAERVFVTGNMKYDRQIHEGGHLKNADEIRRCFNLKGRLIWLGASTHPGEEAFLIQRYLTLRRNFKELFLILAPRHPHRVKEIATYARTLGLRSALRSTQGGESYDLMFLDTFGELMDFYALADIVFVGKSLKASSKARGGQNIFEPACLGKPILCGPRMENFRSIVEPLRENQALVQLGEDSELEAKMRWLLTDSQQRGECGMRAKKMSLQWKGATKRNFDLLMNGLKHARINATS